jgi:membrane protein implicated in regulation of membrane protease activity
MNADCSCKAPAKGLAGAAGKAGPLRRGLHALGWLGPGAVLVLLPKCPVCMAGYIAVLTGLGVSLTTAAAVRFSLMVVCIAALAYLVVRRARRVASRPRRHPLRCPG